MAAANRLAPQLTARCTVFLSPTFPDTSLLPQWAARFDHPDPSLFPAEVVTAGLERLPGLGYRLVVEQDGIAIWRRAQRTL